MITWAPDSRPTLRVSNLDARSSNRVATWRERIAKARYEASLPKGEPSLIERLTAWYSRSQWVGYALLLFGIACFALAVWAAVVGWRVR